MTDVSIAPADGLSEPLTPEQPWPGLEAFGERDAHFFFGRERICADLTGLIERHPFVVLHGRSGLGKTSLLQAGCFPLLRARQFLPVRIRFNFDSRLAPGATTGGRVFVEQVGHAIQHAVRDGHAECPPLPPDETMWEWFHRTDASFWSERSRLLVPVLVFDQFEELFTMGRSPEWSAATDRLLDQLFDLVRGTMPDEVRQRCELEPGTASRFAPSRDGCHVVLSLRRDYLSELLRLRRRMPTLLESHFELRGMTREEAERVVTGPGGHLVESGLAPEIVAFVASAKRSAREEAIDDMVDPAILSVFCRALNLKRPPDGLITRDLLEGKQESIIASFYEESLEGLDVRVRVFLEERLLTESGFRNSVAYEEGPLEREGLDAASIQVLIDRRLLRRESLEGGLPRLELTHDVLVDPILASRNKRRATEEEQRKLHELEMLREAEAVEREQRQRELEAAQKLLEQEQQNLRLSRAIEEQQRRDLRRSRILVMTVAALLVVTIVIAALAVRATFRAREALASAARAHVQQAMRLADAGQADEAMGYLARALRLDAGLAARALAFDALIHRNWPLPVAVFRHDRAVRDARFNADGTRIVTVSDDGTARLWDSASGRAIGQSLPHGPGGSGEPISVFLARFSPDSKVLLTLARDGVARLWSVGDLVRGHRVEHRGTQVTWASFGAGGRRLATGAEDGTVEVWSLDGVDVGRPQPLTDPQVRVRSTDRQQAGLPPPRPSAHDGALTGAQFSADGTLLVTAGKDGAARVWNVGTGRIVSRLLGHTDAVVSAQFSPDAKSVATASRDRTARLWDTATGRLLATVQHNAAVIAVQFSRAADRIVTASEDRTVRVWRVPSGEPVGDPLAHDGMVRAFALASDGRRLLTGTDDGSVRLWDIESSRQVIEPIHHSGPVTMVQFSPNGQRALTASVDGTARLWDIRPGSSRPLELDANSTVLAVRFFDSDRQMALVTAAGRALTVGAANGVVRRDIPLGGTVSWAQFSPADAQLVFVVDGKARVMPWAGSAPTTLQVPAGTGAHGAAWFSTDGTQVIVSEYAAAGLEASAARVYDVASGRPVSGPIVHKALIWSAEFSPDGSAIATASQDGTVRLSNSRTGQPLGPPLVHGDAVVSAHFSRDGTRIITASRDSTAKIWRTDGSPDALATLKHDAPVTTAQFSPSGSLVVTASADGTARVWIPDAQEPIATLPHGAEVSLALFSPDGERLITGAGGTLRVWELATRQLLMVFRPADSSSQSIPVYVAQWSESGERLATSGADGMLRVWDAPAGHPSDAPFLAGAIEAFGGHWVDDVGATRRIDGLWALGNLRNQLQAGGGTIDTDVRAVTRWALEDRGKRTIGPYSSKKN